MTVFKNANNAQAPIKTAIWVSATTVVADAWYGSLFPTGNFILTLENRDPTDLSKVLKREIVLCTSRTGDVCTITRSYGFCPSAWNSLTQTNTAFSFAVGDTMTHTLTAEQAEGMASSIQNQEFTSATATGAVNTYAITLSPAPTVYTAGMRISFLSNLANTATATVNVNGLGAKTLKKLGGTADLVAGDIDIGQIVDAIYDGTHFEMQTPVTNLSPVNISGQTEITTVAHDDELLIYSQTAGANRKWKARTLVKFGGTGADGAVDGTANITLTGSNNTLIERNYTSWAAGGAPRTFTVTPTGCILYIRIKGNADFNNWTFNLTGKGAQGGAGVTFVASLPWNPGASSAFFINTGWAWGASGANQWGSGASCTTNGTQGGGGGGLGGVSSLRSANLYELLKTADIDCGAGGGSGGAGNTGTSGTGGAGGGCIIIEVSGNLSLTGSAINANGSAATNSTNGGQGGSGGGGGGGILVVYSGTLTGSLTSNVTGGAGGTGSLTWPTGAAWVARLYKNNYLT